MKKITFISAFALIFVMLMSVAAYAATPTASLSSSASSVYAGGTVTVTVKVSNCSSTSLGIIPSYDTDNFELVSGEWLVTGAALSDFSDGCAVIAYASSNNFNGNVFKFVLKAKSNAKVNSYTVKCEVQAEGYTVTNPTCTVSVACNHSWGKWTQVNATTHTRTCSKCNATETKNHTYDNACDTTCNDCGYTRTVTHSYKTTWSSDGTSHWHQCSICGAKKDEAKHTPGAAATEENAQTCTVCGYVIQKALTHTHTLETTLTQTANGHGYKCTKCGEIVNVEAHKYDNSCDTTCNVCGYMRTITHSYSTDYKSDATGHWYACTVCGDKKDFTAHTPGAEATEESPQLCTVCGYEIAPAKAHEHVYTGDYVYNETEHWKCCKCGDESAHEAHAWDSGTVVKEATKDDNGTKTYKCTVCGYEKQVELELVYTENEDPGTTTEPITTTDPVVTTDPGEDNPVTPGDDDRQDSGIPPLIAGIIGAAAMLFICLIPIVILIKKKNN